MPLYEGKMVQVFDHRAASIAVNPTNLTRQAQSIESTLKERMDPDFLPKPAFWISASAYQPRFRNQWEWTLVYRRITAPTNARTTIATLLPWCGGQLYHSDAALRRPRVLCLGGGLPAISPV